MISVQKVIFPGMIAGCLFLVFVVNMIANPSIALASSPKPAPAQSGASSSAARPEIQPTKQPAKEAAQGTGASGTDSANAEQKSGEAKSGGGGCSISAAYPDAIQQWCEIIERYAGENNLDPNLLAAVMLQESGGNPSAYSKSGAVGLLQVMPKDGLASSFMCVNGPCFSSRPSMEELYDPEFNVSYGARMLAGLVQKYGDVREALYKYGPNNMGYRYADIILSIFERYR